MRKLLVVALALLAPTVALPQGAVRIQHQAIERTRPAIENTMWSRVLISEGPDLKSHVVFDGQRAIDTRSNLWTTIGTLTFVPAGTAVTGAGLLPAGGGPFSISNYLKHDPLGTGADALDFTADFFIVAVYKPTATASQPYFSNSNGSSTGYYASSNPGTGRILTTFDPTGHGLNSATTKPVAAAVNVICTGRSGSNIVGTVNAGTQVTLAGGVAAGTGSPALIGTSGDGFNAADGVLYELAVFQATPTSDGCAAYIADVKRKANITSW